MRCVHLCHKANFGVKVEASSVLTPDLSRSHPADALVNNWTGGNPAPLSIPIALLHLVQEPLRQRFVALRIANESHPNISLFDYSHL